jgi:hypothetical protein
MPGAADERATYLRRIIRLRVELVIVSLLLASLLLFVLEYLGKSRHWEWANVTPLDALATTALSTGIIGVIWEWFIRRDAAAHLRRTLVELTDEERPVLAREVATTFITDDDLLRSLISTNNSERVLRAALASITDNPGLSDGLRRGIIEGALSAEDYWENYRARIFIEDSTDLLDAGDPLDSFFDFHVEIRYEMQLRKSIFRLAAATSIPTLKEINADRAFDGCWLVAPSRPYTAITDELFLLEYMRIEDIDLDISSRREADRMIYTAESSRLGALIGRRVGIEYRYRMKFDKRGHIFSMNVRVPTRKASYELDYAQSTIVHVNVFDFFVSGGPVRIRTGAAASRRGAVEVEATDWVFRGGGVAFAWVLRTEHDPSFLGEIGRPPAPSDD